MINPIARKIKQVTQQGVAWLETRFKQWTRPAASHQVRGTLADLRYTPWECKTNRDRDGGLDKRAQMGKRRAFFCALRPRERHTCPTTFASNP